jgi:hypothetical protein
MNVQQRLRRAMLPVVLAIAASTAFAAAATYTPETHDPRRSIHGVVSEYHGGIMKVETPKGEAWEFNVLPETGIAVNGAAAERGSLEPGMQVEVTPSREEPSRASSVVATNPKTRRVVDPSSSSAVPDDGTPANR